MAGNFRVDWSSVRQALTRPYQVPASMVVLLALVPVYLVIAGRARGGMAFVPAVPLDALLPLVPSSALVYGALYVFLIVLPVLVVQDPELVRRMFRAYLAVWVAAYVCFLLYPTIAPRPESVTGTGFGAWGLRVLYDADPPYNCFPSLHVAHSFVSALACYQVHRALGRVTLACASLVAVSTLLTKQHYVLDVVAGTAMALLAWAVFMRPYPRTSLSELERRVAPQLALVTAGIILTGLAGFWVAFRLLGGGSVSGDG